MHIVVSFIDIHYYWLSIVV